MTDSSDAAVFGRLRALKARCGPNKHDQAIALIAACILEGWNTGKRIVGALGAIGMNPRHVGKMLSDGAGASPDRHFWRRSQDGRYSLHDEAVKS